jgi:hypothetical protein
MLIVLIILIGLILGAAFGLVGLRLLACWNDRPLAGPDLDWRHWRH